MQEESPLVFEAFGGVCFSQLTAWNKTEDRRDPHKMKSHVAIKMVWPSMSPKGFQVASSFRWEKLLIRKQLEAMLQASCPILGSPLWHSSGTKAPTLARDQLRQGVLRRLVRHLGLLDCSGLTADRADWSSRSKSKSCFFLLWLVEQLIHFFPLIRWVR